MSPFSHESPSTSPSPIPPIIDQGVPLSKETPVPRWLLWSYCLLPILGLIILYAFWDGSFGWFDRGAWGALQQAANTK